MSSKIILIVSTMLFFMACGKHKENSVDVKKEDKVMVSNQIASASKLAWLEYRHVSQDDFEFKKEWEMKADTVLYGLFEDQKKWHSTTFAYSPDSTFYIDIDTYGVALEKDEDGKFAYYGREVDIKVCLVRTAAPDSIAVELMMCGTACLPEEASWENDTTVSILGVSDDDGLDRELPTIWQYNLNTKSFVKFVAQKETSVTKGNYFEDKRLPKILAEANR